MNFWKKILKMQFQTIIFNFASALIPDLHIHLQVNKYLIFCCRNVLIQTLHKYIDCLKFLIKD